MKGVEQILPSFRWADEFTVVQSASIVSFEGKKFYAPRKSKSKELIAGYLERISSVKAGDDQNAPHYKFANAHSDAALLAYLKAYGPVISEPETLKMTTLIGSQGPGIIVSVDEEVHNIRREQITYNAVLSLYEELNRPQADLQALMGAAVSIQAGTSQWSGQYDRESQFAQKSPVLSDERRWHWNDTRQRHLQSKVSALESYSRPGTESFSKAIDSGHRILCDVLNAFPVSLTHAHGSPIEIPSENLAFGIRHVLYFLLRCDYLWKAKIGRCAWKDCTRWFRRGSQESPCCSPEHALKYRQWRYYHESKGMKVRKQRYKKLEKPKRRATSAEQRKEQ